MTVVSCDEIDSVGDFLKFSQPHLCLHIVYVNTCICVYLYICMYICMSISIYPNAYVYVYVYVLYIYIHIYTHIFVYTCT